MLPSFVKHYLLRCQYQYAVSAHKVQVVVEVITLLLHAMCDMLHTGQGLCEAQRGFEEQRATDAKGITGPLHWS